MGRKQTPEIWQCKLTSKRQTIWWTISEKVHLFFSPISPAIFYITYCVQMERNWSFIMKACLLGSLHLKTLGNIFYLFLNSELWHESASFSVMREESGILLKPVNPSRQKSFPFNSHRVLGSCWLFRNKYNSAQWYNSMWDLLEVQPDPTPR